MKPNWLIATLFLSGLPVAGFCAGATAPAYAIVPDVPRTAGATPGQPAKLQSAPGEGQWLPVGQNPTFRLQFADVTDNTGSGFDDPVLGQSRRAVAVQAFERMSRILDGEPGSANILIDSRSEYFSSDVLAVGIPFFLCRPGFQKPIIFDALRNDVHIHDREGDLLVNFSLPLSATMAPPAPGEYDLFTLLLHEITHILGFVGFTVQADGLPRDCGGARMLPAMARHATDGSGNRLWLEQGGEIAYVGQAQDLPSAEAPLRLDFPGEIPFSAHLATGNLVVSGHWTPEDFANRRGVLMLREPFPSGITRRNMTPETKAVLESALEYTVNEEPRGLTGSWYDPASTGQGFSLHFVTRDRFVVYFFGFTDAGERLWMIGVHDDGLRLGEEFQVSLYETTGGRFNDFNAEDVVELPWGQLNVRFHDCLNAQATLTGLDGSQELELTHLAGVDGLDCF